MASRKALSFVTPVVFAASLGLARTAAAQSAPAHVDFSRAAIVAAVAAAGAPAAREDRAATIEPSDSHGSALMTSLYATTALVQGLDAHSTLTALHHGAHEGNPLMAYLTGHPPAFVALKAGAATGLIMAGRRLAKHSKLEAAVALIAIDSAYFAIAAHNYSIANRPR